MVPAPQGRNGATLMFPKQRCPMCQNRAWEGTTSGGLVLENHRLKERIESFKREIEFRDTTIDSLENELA